MAPRIKATKTINPLHFEDLEPHRFEDLVRRLLYSFKDWSNIEATGRAGSDEGFDIRAWERGEGITNISDENEEGEHELEGRLWQVQGKREKAIAPAKMRSIIKDGVDGENPPYGYILSAATNISKSAYDAFREELRAKGVREFHFWGKDYLEDQLSLPENDEILFTFFGLSLSPRRRSRTAELKFNINNKNKILRLVFGNEKLFHNQQVPRVTLVLRDIKAEHYPYTNNYPDFEKYRRWEEHDVVDVGPRGIMFKVRDRYACLDREKKEWDFTPAVDLTLRKHNIDQSNRLRLEDEGKKVERFWRHLPKRLQAKLMIYGFVSFEDILIIDDKGDPEYTDPHIFLDFGAEGPFQYRIANLVQHHDPIDLEDLKRVKIFPEQFPEIIKGTVHDLDQLGLYSEAASSLRYLRGSAELYSFDRKLKSLSENDLIRIPKQETDRMGHDKHAEVTHVDVRTVGMVLEERGSHFREALQKYAGRKLNDDDKLEVYEVQEVSVFDSGNIYYSDSN